MTDPLKKVRFSVQNQIFTISPKCVRKARKLWYTLEDRIEQDRKLMEEEKTFGDNADNMKLSKTKSLNDLMMLNIESDSTEMTSLTSCDHDFYCDDGAFEF